MHAIIILLAISLVVGFFGRRTCLGFWGFFFCSAVCSVFISPFISPILLVAMLAERKSVIRELTSNSEES